MKKTVINILSVLLAGSLVLEPVETSAEGKTTGAYKCTKYTNKKCPDAKTIYQGVKNYDNNYSGKYLKASSDEITSAHFYDKSKTIKYWSSHGLLSGNLFGNDTYDDALSDDEEEAVVAYTVSFPHIYDGYTVEGDKLAAIIDGEGVKYNAVNWNEI